MLPVVPAIVLDAIVVKNAEDPHTLVAVDVVKDADVPMNLFAVAVAGLLMHHWKFELSCELNDVLTPAANVVHAILFHL
jgi:hypothetical protein